MSLSLDRVRDNLIYIVSSSLDILDIFLELRKMDDYLSQLSDDQIEAIEELIEIKDRDPDTMSEQDYVRRNELAEYLFGTSSLQDAFSRKHHEFCPATVIWITNYGSLTKIRDSRQGEVYTSNGRLGGSIRIWPRKDNLAKCLNTRKESTGIYLYFDGHSNIIWLDTERMKIYRYDPQIPKEDVETKPIDGSLRAFFNEILPDYKYLGNTLSLKDCVQGVRWSERGFLDCFCQEYTLLYAQNRLFGMNHVEAARDLVNNRDKILDLIRNLYAHMSV